MDDGMGVQYTYNAQGQILTIVGPDGKVLQINTYDAEGCYQYNRAGKIAAIVDPTGEQETYLYDGENRLIQKTDRNGVTVEFGYNLYGVSLFRKEMNGTLGDFYEYTPESLVQCAISAGMRYNYTYDVMGRMVEKSASGRTLLALYYDQNGNKVRQTDVAGKVTEYTYSPLDLLITVCDDGGKLAAYDYNPDGTVKSLAHGSGRQDYTMTWTRISLA